MVLNPFFFKLSGASKNLSLGKERYFLSVVQIYFAKKKIKFCQSKAVLVLRVLWQLLLKAKQRGDFLCRAEASWHSSM